MDAIESGPGKIPPLPASNPNGAALSQYFNLWQLIMGQLSATERAGQRGGVKPSSVLKRAHTPIAMLAGEREEEHTRWSEREDGRSPVFTIVCKDTALAKVVYEWNANAKGPAGVQALNVAAFRNTNGEINAIGVDTKAVDDSSAEGAQTRRARHSTGR